MTANDRLADGSREGSIGSLCRALHTRAGDHNANGTQQSTPERVVELKLCNTKKTVVPFPSVPTAVTSWTQTRQQDETNGSSREGGREENKAAAACSKHAGNQRGAGKGAKAAERAARGMRSGEAGSAEKLLVLLLSLAFRSLDHSRY